MLRMLTLIMLLGTAFSGNAATVQSRGGSNWNWYRNDINGTTCVREPYHIVKNYHTVSPNGTAVRTIVRNQLTSFYQAGQRRLRIALFFSYTGESGSVVKVGTTGFPQYYIQNLKNFLADIRSVGMQEVEIALFPIGISEVIRLNPGIHWTMIQQAHDAGAASAIPFLLDFGNEMMPSLGDTINTDVAADYWNLYTSKYGSQRSVGFSVPLSAQRDLARIDNLRNVYGSNFPSAIQVHNYYNVPGGYSNFYSLVFYAAERMDDAGIPLNIPFIIGEAFYNDTLTAQKLNEYLYYSGAPRDIKFLLQWPISRDGFNSPACDPSVTDITINFQNYINQGF